MRGAVLAFALAGCAAQEARSDASCTPCHAEIAAEHQTGHGRSAASPVFEALVPRAEAAWGAEAADACRGCHTPPPPPDGATGHVACAHCHSAFGNAGERDALLLVDWKKPLAAGRGADLGAAPHRLRDGELLASASLCLTCHEVTGPGTFVEPIASEFAAFAGPETCIDCHMPPSNGRASHRFVGLSPPWSTGPEAEERAAASAELVASALALGATLEDGGVRVSLANGGAGHAVPTGVAFFRRIWVRVRLVDPSGAVAFSAGEVDAAGLLLSAPALALGSELRREGEIVWDPTIADEVTSRSVAPGASVEALVPLPSCAGCSLEVSLLARGFAGEALATLDLEDRAAEVPTLVARTLTLETPP